MCIRDRPNTEQGSSTFMGMTTQPPDPEVGSNEKVDLNDPAKWVVNNNLQDYIAEHGISQNDNLDFSKYAHQYGNKKDFYQNVFFNKNLKNGKTVKRRWLSYSPSIGNVFCVPCKLYGGTTSLATSGFND